MVVSWEPDDLDDLEWFEHYDDSTEEDVLFDVVDQVHHYWMNHYGSVAFFDFYKLAASIKRNYPVRARA